MKNKISITDFNFEFKGNGNYLVTYTSPVTLKEWTKNIYDMHLIDSTKNQDNPKIKDLNHLKMFVKR